MNWIETKYRPNYNKRVLLCSTGGGVFIGELKEKPIHNKDGWEVEGNEGNIIVRDYFSHWMQLPGPPH